VPEADLGTVQRLVDVPKDVQKALGRGVLPTEAGLFGVDKLIASNADTRTVAMVSNPRHECEHNDGECIWLVHVPNECATELAPFVIRYREHRYHLVKCITLATGGYSS
jgi:hypothetical protein